MPSPGDTVPNTGGWSVYRKALRVAAPAAERESNRLAELVLPAFTPLAEAAKPGESTLGARREARATAGRRSFGRAPLPAAERPRPADPESPSKGRPHLSLWSLQPDAVEVWAAWSAGKLTSVEPRIRHKVFFEPDNPVWRFLQGAVLWEQGWLRRARREIEQAERLLAAVPAEAAVSGLCSAAELRRVIEDLVGDLLRSLAGRRFAFAVVAQHIVPDFADGFRAWLAEHTGRPVRAARNGEIPEPGGIYTIPGSCHLQLTPDGRFRVEPGSVRDTLHVPSVDVLFTSLVALRPRSTIAILLTGMGHDGAEGLLGLRQAGALTVAQAPASAAVDSMPRSAIERDAAAQVLAPPEIARLLEQLPSAALTRHR